jgi:hypothetical protein
LLQQTRVYSRAVAIHHCCVLEEHQVKPTTASHSLGCHTNLTAPSLQEISSSLHKTLQPVGKTHSTTSIVHRYCLLTSSSSVGKGPSPTLVVYAFTTPITSPMLHGGSPRPVHTPPMLQLDEVTYGYVPEIHSECQVLGKQT